MRSQALEVVFGVGLGSGVGFVSEGDGDGGGDCEGEVKYLSGHSGHRAMLGGGCV